MTVAAYIATTLALASALALASRSRSYRPVAWLLGLELVQDLARRLIAYVVLTPYRELHGTPYQGWTRVAFHVHQALLLAWPAAVAATALRTLAARRARPALVGYGLAVAFAVLAYPWLRGDRLATFYAVVEAACVVTGGWCAWRFVQASPRPTKAERPAGLATIWVVAMEGAVLMGPYFIGGVFAWWPEAVVLYTVMHVVLAVAQGAALWSRPTTP